MIRIILDRLTVECTNTDELEAILAVTSQALGKSDRMMKLALTTCPEPEEDTDE